MFSCGFGGSGRWKASREESDGTRPVCSGVLHSDASPDSEMRTGVMHCGSVRVQVCVRSSSRGHGAAGARLQPDTLFPSFDRHVLVLGERNKQEYIFNSVFPFSENGEREVRVKSHVCVRSDVRHSYTCDLFCRLNKSIRKLVSFSGYCVSSHSRRI